MIVIRLCLLNWRLIYVILTLSLPIPLRLYTLPYWSNPPFSIFDQSARMSNIENGGLDQYGARSFEQQQFGTAGVEGVTYHRHQWNVTWTALMSRVVLLSDESYWTDTMANCIYEADLRSLDRLSFTRINMTTLRSGLCYLKSVCRLSVTFVRRIYSGGWSFRQYFFAIVYHNHPLTSV